MEVNILSVVIEEGAMISIAIRQRNVPAYKVSLDRERREEHAKTAKFSSQSSQTLLPRFKQTFNSFFQTTKGSEKC